MPDRADNDFGFSFEGEDFVAPSERERIDSKETELNSKVEGLAIESKKYQERLEHVLSLIMPLLYNLASNPDKPTIYWPNRVEKVNAFKEKLLKAAGRDIGSGPYTAGINKSDE